jgi:hypothetical protein
MDDIRESVAELAYYRTAVFRGARPVTSPAVPGADGHDGTDGQPREDHP